MNPVPFLVVAFVLTAFAAVFLFLACWIIRQASSPLVWTAVVPMFMSIVMLGMGTAFTMEALTSYDWWRLKRKMSEPIFTPSSGAPPVKKLITLKEDGCRQVVFTNTPNWEKFHAFCKDLHPAARCCVAQRLRHPV